MTKVEPNGWRISKEIPVALIVSISASLFLGGIGYQSLKGDVTALAVTQKEMREESKDAKSDVREIGKTLQDGSGPLAVSASRLSALEAAVNDIRSRVAENERKVLRFDVMLGSKQK